MVSTMGLVLGVTVLIVVLSVMNGFERELRTRILGVLPQGMIIGREPIADWQEVLAETRLHPRVEAAAPYISGAGILAANGTVAGVTYTGVLPEYEQQVSILGDFFVAGNWQALAATRFGMVVGRPLMQDLGLTIGDQVSLVLPEATITIAGLMPRIKRFTIIGSFEVGADMDKNLVLINLNDAAALKRLGGKVDGIRILTDDLFAVPSVLREILVSLDSRDYTASSWMRMYGNLYEAIRMQKTTMFLLLILIIAVAAFNVVSSLIMMVAEKKGEIAILRTLGAAPTTVMGIFIFYGTVIGFLGAVVGVVCGVSLAMLVSDLFKWLDSLTQVDIMNQYFIKYLPSEVLASDVLLIAISTLFICFLATLYPAYKAAKSHPAEALRYE